jgi:phosphoribosylformylglycinamidine cyclo-ligase
VPTEVAEGAGDLLPESTGGGSASYAGAGVNLQAAEEAVSRIAGIVASTFRPEVLGGIGGFGGSFALDVSKVASPVLVASTDGVGTKLVVAQATRRYDTVGIDLVAMCVDDLVCLGAEPLFLLDYIATGHLDPDEIEALVGGVAEGCRQAGCALLGGEIAEHPGEIPEGQFDIAGFAVGVVDRSERLEPERVVVGDVLVGLLSPGLRSNGYSLARKVLLEDAGLPLDGPSWEGANTTLADELLRPSVIYAPAVLDGVRAGRPIGSGAVHAAAHITGGGLPGNLIRALPEGCAAVVDRSRWTEPEIFGVIRRAGPVEDVEMERVFNLGVGMVLVVDPEGLDLVLDGLRRRVPAVVIGEVVSGDRGVRLSAAGGVPG